MSTAFQLSNFDLAEPSLSEEMNFPLFKKGLMLKATAD